MLWLKCPYGVPNGSISASLHYLKQTSVVLGSDSWHTPGEALGASGGCTHTHTHIRDTQSGNVYAEKTETHALTKTRINTTPPKTSSLSLSNLLPGSSHQTCQPTGGWENSERGLERRRPPSWLGSSRRLPPCAKMIMTSLASPRPQRSSSEELEGGLEWMVGRGLALQVEGHSLIPAVDLFFNKRWVVKGSSWALWGKKEEESEWNPVRNIRLLWCPLILAQVTHFWIHFLVDWTCFPHWKLVNSLIPKLIKQKDWTVRIEADLKQLLPAAHEFIETQYCVSANTKCHTSPPCLSFSIYLPDDSFILPSLFLSFPDSASPDITDSPCVKVQCGMQDKQILASFAISRMDWGLKWTGARLGWASVGTEGQTPARTTETCSCQHGLGGKLIACHTGASVIWLQRINIYNHTYAKVIKMKRRILTKSKNRFYWAQYLRNLLS